MPQNSLMTHTKDLADVASLPDRSSEDQVAADTVCDIPFQEIQETVVDVRPVRKITHIELPCVDEFCAEDDILTPMNHFRSIFY